MKPRSKTDTIVIHCAATKPNMDIGVDEITKWHTDRGFDTIGYHYYMTPETAQLGIDKFQEAVNKKPKQWVWTDWPDLRNMEVFK